MKKSFVLFVLLFILFSFVSFGQKWKMTRYEAIFGAGAANYFGDIGGTPDEGNLMGLKDLTIGETRPSFYLGVRYKIEQDIAIRVNFIYGFVTGDDANSRNDGRGYSFSATAFEPSVQIEYYFVKEERKFRSNMFGRSGLVNNYSRLSVYYFAGAGVLFFNPKFEGDISYREPEEYSGYIKMALVIPTGIGIKFIISSKWVIGFEIGGRLTTTDYLDNFSSRYTNANDVYYFSVVNFMYRIKTSRRGWPILFRR